MFAFRAMRRSPGYFATVIATLALGVGLATAVFTVANTLLVNKLPIRDENRVVALWGATADGSNSNFPSRVEEVREFGRSTQSLDAVGFFGYETLLSSTFRTDGGTFRLRRAMVSGNFFDVIGTRPAFG